MDCQHHLRCAQSFPTASGTTKAGEHDPINVATSILHACAVLRNPFNAAEWQKGHIHGQRERYSNAVPSQLCLCLGSQLDLVGLRAIHRFYFHALRYLLPAQIFDPLVTPASCYMSIVQYHITSSWRLLNLKSNKQVVREFHHAELLRALFFHRHIILAYQRCRTFTRRG